jgi:hypothetical protein
MNKSNKTKQKKHFLNNYWNRFQFIKLVFNSVFNDSSESHLKQFLNFFLE